MQKLMSVCLLAFAFLLGASPLYAAPVVIESSGTGTGSGTDSYLGDIVHFEGNVQVTVYDATNGSGSMSACLPAGVRLTGISQDGTRWILTGGDKNPNWCRSCDNKTCDLTGNYSCQYWVLQTCDSVVAGATPKVIVPGSYIEVSADALAKSGLIRQGFSWGILAVPYKFQLTHGHEYTGSATVGSYLGYRCASPGMATTFAAFGGASNISVSKNGSTQQLAGFSYGLGTLLEFKGGFQSGLVLGFDGVGNNEHYQYSNMPWIAIELGYSFTQGSSK